MSEFIPLATTGSFDVDADVSAEPTVSVQEWENAIEVDFTFPGFWLGDAEPARADVDEAFREVGISGSGFVSESGRPLMPSFGRFVQIPHGVDVEVTVANSQPVEYEDVLVTPAQERALDGSDRADEFEFDHDFYGRDALYPERIVEVGDPQELDGYRVLLLHVRPLRFNPAKRTLSGHANVKVTIRLTPADDVAADDDLASARFDPSMSREGFGNLVLNPRRRIEERVASPAGPRPTPLRLMGPELLIIHDRALKPAADRLSDWKNRKGIVTETVSIGTVRNSVGSIKKYVRQARRKYARLRYVLLLGDVAAIKTEQRGSVTTDHYYFTPRDPTGSSDCVLPWVSGGRIPTGSLDEANAIVQQIVEYERRPPCDPEYYRRMTAAAYFQDHDHDGRAERAYMKTMEGIRSHMVGLGFDVERVYVSSSTSPPQQYKDGSVVPADVQNAIVDAGLATQMLISETSEGQLLIGHRDHGGPSGWVDPPFQNQHLQAILSDDPTIFYSVNCSTGRFDMSSGDSFAEDILEHTGAAPTLVAATEDSGTWRNDSLMKGLFDAMWPGVIPTFPGSTASYPVRHHRIGDVLNYAKSYLLVAHGTNSGVQHHFEIYHVIGDPTLQLWAHEPMPLRLTAKVQRRTLSIRLTPAADCVVTIWHGKRQLKRISPASSQISLPLRDLGLPSSALPSGRVGLEICASAPGYRFARRRVGLPVPIR